MSEQRRCSWCNTNPIYIAYHDNEWGRPERDSLKLFEMLCLEGMQAGLSWLTILLRRDNYQRAFHGFDPNKIAQMTENDVARLMQDAGIIRNRLKINAIIKNAHAYLQLTEAQEFSDFLWGFVEHQPVIRAKGSGAIPAETEVSKALSQALKKLGFTFVGPTICYAFMQAVGMVNDHEDDCAIDRAFEHLGFQDMLSSS